MKAILMSIKAEHNANIEAGRKLLELRKRIPKCELPVKVYTYESGKNGRHKITNEWVCREIVRHCESRNKLLAGFLANVNYDFMSDYANDKEVYGMQISDIVIYEKPRELNEFCTVDEKAVQSCIRREQVGQPQYVTKNGGELKGGFICNDTEDWCTKCKRKPIAKPPQSWCYLEV